MFALRFAALLLILGSLLYLHGRQDASAPLRRVDLDLLYAYPATAAAAHALSLSLTTPLGRAHLGPGWSAPRTLASGDVAVIGLHRRSLFELEFDSVQEREIVLRCAAPQSRQARPRAVVNLNGKRIGVLRLTGHLAETRFRLPADAQRAGANTVELVNPKLGSIARRRHRRHSENERIACTHLTVDVPANTVVEATPRPQLVTGAAGIHFPPGASLTWFADLGRAAAIELLLVSATSADAPVTLRVTGRDARQREHVTTLTDDTTISFDLSPLGEQIVAITLMNSGRDTMILKSGTLTSVEPPSPPRPARRPAGPAPTFILLFLVDTLRADHLGTYGYDRDTSPHIDALAKEALVFENVVAQSSWTTPAVASILTGVNPETHGAEHLSERMRTNIPSLAAELQSAGWRTGAFVTNTNARGELGFARGFDTHQLLPENTDSPGVSPSADALIERALAWIDKTPPLKTFLYLHASDPHGPYNPEPPFRDRFAPGDASAGLRASPDPLALFRKQPRLHTEANSDLLIARYDEEIAYTDSAFGRLRDELQARGLWEDALIVFTSDHGEEFHDHGHFGHGRTLYGEQLDVPLVLRIPGTDPARVPELARQIDIAPTILEAAGLTPPATMEGRSLLAAGPARIARSRSFLGNTDTRARTHGRQRHIRKRDGDGHITYEAYDLAPDPTEQSSLTANDPILRGWIRQTFALERLAATTKRRPEDTPREIEIDAATRARLQALGYLEED
ncbi:MAG: sulfatase [Deltaproteobacteria bacterium]